jgi:predicted O-methyltransferase YrrM
MNKVVGIIFLVLDLILWPLSLLAACWFRIAKYLGLYKLPLLKHTLFRVGVFPIVDHYYEPLFNPQRASTDWRREYLLNFELNDQQQIELIERLNYYNSELVELPIHPIKKEPHFFLRNGSFVGLDAYFLFALIRHFKPRKIIEIGSGLSTLLMLGAIQKNESEGHSVSLTCVEPFEASFLEKLKINVIRKRVEQIDPVFFEQLDAGDILFIDSSHVLRPHGDVMFEFFEILPRIKRGVLIHFHDIFLPQEYPEKWLTKHFRLWNEQYLLQAFMTSNNEYTVFLSVNYLASKYRHLIMDIFPFIEKPDIGGCSFWIKKN